MKLNLFGKLFRKKGPIPAGIDIDIDINYVLKGIKKKTVRHWYDKVTFVHGISWRNEQMTSQISKCIQINEDLYKKLNASETMLEASKKRLNERKDSITMTIKSKLSQAPSQAKFL